MQWFTENSPIRQKMAIVTAAMVGFSVLAMLTGALVAEFAPLWVALLAGLVPVGGAFVAARLMSTGVVVPYVATVERMEALARGDTDSPINYTHFTDCIGRLTKAMFTFRETAITQRKVVVEQQAIVDEMNTSLLRLSEGDMTRTITTDFPSEYASLKTNFNQAVLNLRNLIGSVSESAATIRTGSDEIAQASEDLARRTEANAASLEHTASSVTQMDSRLKASATAAARTVERADQAISTVGGGRAVADEAVQAMGRVADSAKGIDSVIEGLDKIAFQTRVLAMNAAVEAGRAGDAGRGFAVVADLVSALAMRSEEEAKRAREQLTATQTDIVTAVQAVQKVDGALSAISGDVAQVHELLATMATDNLAQATAITQISSAVGSMDRATQQNAAMVEQTSAAARNLANEVGTLAEKASHFKTDARRGGDQRPAVRKIDIASFNQPIRPLPAAAVTALTPNGTDDDWKEF
ncbi:chemotaxis protein [Sphingomonas sp. S-NIH.Pt15_0812]|jgi:methyl-accepting chemotaxis protein|nr:methyl-accepting chemotaxis protein [Sphingomonas sp. S-NIH.Pt15_0812]RSU47877.1 chemotaxis protein [Sphingomonas sp. S-NIH.Pt15_0812]